MIFVLNGPNLNALGTRETEIYGTVTFAELEALCRNHAETIGVAIDWRQSSHEGTLVDWIHESQNASAAGLIINPAAYAHDSLALYDALRMCASPAIEVHISNIHAREPFRRRFRTAAASDGVICGCGIYGYILALDGLKQRLTAETM